VAGINMHPNPPLITYPPLAPYKGGIFLNENGKGATCLVAWQLVFDYIADLPMTAIPGTKSLVLPKDVWVWRNDRWEMDDEGTAHVKRFSDSESFNPLSVNIIDIPDPSVEAGICYGGENRREWTIGNWISHLGGRINERGYLEFGSIYAFNMMLAQMLRADFKEKEDKMRITIDGGSESMKVAMSMLLAGSLGDNNFTPGPHLQKLIDESQARPVNLDAIVQQARQFEQMDIIIDVLPPLRR
jgi:hypothetical protein